jgi:peptide deformylase
MTTTSRPRRELLRLGDPALRRASVPVTSPATGTPAFLELADELSYVLEGHHAAAVAAPQLGCHARVVAYARRAFDDRSWAAMGGAGGSVLVHVNPSFAALGDDTVLDFEGCLSIPRIVGLVSRHRVVRYSAESADGLLITADLTGLPARVVQHETQHLDGTLLLDLADSRGLMTTGSVSRIYGRDPRLAARLLLVSPP